MTIHVLLSVLKEIEMLPPILNLQRDNTARENKNRFVLGFCALLVSKKIFKKVHISNIHVVTCITIVQETKTFAMLGEVGMANESTKTTQTSVRMAQHNERTRLHDLLCTPTNLRVH